MMSAEKETGAGPANDAPSPEEEARGCGILGRYPVVAVLSFAAAGVALGVGLSSWEPDDSQDKATTIQWIGLVGDMFIRALKATVLPLVFVNVILSMVEMMSVGRASTVGGKTIGLYICTTVCAAIIGVIVILCMKGLFKTEDIGSSSMSRVQLGCDQAGSFLSYDPSGDVTCAAGLTEENITDSYFFITDVDSTFDRTAKGPRDDISMSDTVYDGVFGKLITSNIFGAFAGGNFAGVVLFAIFMGAALAKVMLNKGLSQTESYFVGFLKEVDAVLTLLIKWIISCTPFAVFSLISSAVGGQDNLQDSFSNVGYLCVATILGLFIHCYVVYPSIYFFTTKSNPFAYYRHILPAQTTAIACASSAATMPVTQQCAERSGLVPSAVARFVIPLGATVNMDGSAIYFPCACVWLAVLNGLNPSFGDYILLVILSTIGSAGSAPVPSAGLVMVLTAYNSVFGTTGAPDGFEFVVAIDWFLDRLRTSVNVTGDAYVAAMIAHLSWDEFETVENPQTQRDGSSEETGSDDLKV